MLRRKNIIKIAIDSPAAAGAGTIAKALSKHYNLYYLDTGKIYRYLAKITFNEKKINYKNLSIFPGDLTNILEAKKFYEFIKKKTKSIDVLICNIGYSTPNNIIGEENYDNWVDSIHLNLFSAINSIYYFKKLLKYSKNPSIVCISSICGIDALGAPIDYSVSKAALISFVKNQSKVLAKNNIRINCVSPGNIFFKNGNWDHKIKNDKKKFLE